MSAIDITDYKSLMNDYAMAWALIELSTDYLLDAVDTVVALNEREPELDMLQDLWDTYSTAVLTIGTEGNLVQGVRSIQAHILKRSSYTNVSDWWEAEAPGEDVPQEWGDLSEYAGYTYDAADIDGPVVI
jgi:hypothetical protein